MTLGQKLRQTRQAKGLSQSQAAEGCITRNMLSQIENDQAMPSMRTLEHLAQVLDVSVGWLLSDEQTDAALERMRKARAMFKNGAYAQCAALLEDGGALDDEALLLLSASAGQLAEQMLQQEDFDRARELAQTALRRSREGLYQMADVQMAALAVLARCALQTPQADEAVAAYRDYYLAQQPTVRYHLMMARFHLQQEHIQAAEREIWSIAELPECERAEYLILRGRIAARKEQFENAALYLHQAEELELAPVLQRELYQGLEVCYREMGQYQQAYEYASKQLAMQK